MAINKDCSNQQHDESGIRYTQTHNLVPFQQYAYRNFFRKNTQKKK